MGLLSFFDNHVVLSHLRKSIKYIACEFLFRAVLLFVFCKRDTSSHEQRTSSFRHKADAKTSRKHANSTVAGDYLVIVFSGIVHLIADSPALASCNKCNHSCAYFLLQIRSADEPMYDDLRL
jgi:DNA-directed RNA polymerase subunit M/transcription elongation factor TFIIS